MTTEINHGQPRTDDSSIVTFAGLPANSIPGDITEIEYESALEATRAERARRARGSGMGGRPGLAGFPEIVLFRYLGARCGGYTERSQSPDCGCPTRPCAGTMSAGDGIAPRRWTSWYQAGYLQSSGLVSVSSEEWRPIALQSLVVLAVTHPQFLEDE